MKYIFRYIFVPNFVFSIFNIYATTSRPIINIDYCIVGIATPFIGRKGGIVLYFLLCLLDLVASFPPTYHLRPIILRNIFRDLSVFRCTTLALLIALVFISLLVMWYFTLKRELFSQQQLGLLSRSTLILTSLLIILADIVNGSNGFVRTREAVFINYNICGSALLKICNDIKISHNKSKLPPIMLKKSEFAMSRVHEDLLKDSLAEQNIVLVIVESWGISKDSALNVAITRPLGNLNLLSRYKVYSSVVPFHGSTVSAELRELYGLRASDPKEIKSAISIPSILASRGYKTIALHGFMPNFFGRNEWYPKAGFGNTLFIDDIKKLQTTNDLCGSTNFRGICDDAVPSMIKQLLLEKTGGPSNKPKLIYWLTLNSHYPYGPPSHSTHFNCKSFGGSVSNQAVCNLSSTLYGVFSSLAKLIDDPDIPATRFVIVGDHSPPFLMRSNEGLYNSAYVPMIEFIPKKHEDTH